MLRTGALGFAAVRAEWGSKEAGTAQLLMLLQRLLSTKPSSELSLRHWLCHELTN